MMNDAELTPYLEAVEKELTSVLEDFGADAPETLYDAMKYAVLGGGKRLRPVLGMLTAETLGFCADEALWVGVAVELIHSYSLVHDDLPCMDNDDIRRGKPSVHKQFGESAAVLCGDALLNTAYNYLLFKARTKETRRAALRIADCASARGMLSGQVLDLSYSQESATVDSLTDIALKKTSRLFSAAVEGTAIALDATPEILDRLGVFCRNFGVAFQIADDLADINSSDEPNFVRFLGEQGARTKGEFHLKTALSALTAIGEAADKLKTFANNCIKF